MAAMGGVQLLASRVPHSRAPKTGPGRFSTDTTTIPQPLPGLLLYVYSLYVSSPSDTVYI